MAGMTQNNKKAFFHCGSSTKIKFSRKKQKKIIQVTSTGFQPTST